MMARSTASNQRPDTLMQDRLPPARRNLLATHGRTIHSGQTGKAQYEQMFSALPPGADIPNPIITRTTALRHKRPIRNGRLGEIKG